MEDKYKISFDEIRALLVEDHYQAEDIANLEKAFEFARSVEGKPVAIIANTIKGKGVSYMENNAGWHGKAPNDAEDEQAMNEPKAQLAGRTHNGSLLYTIQPIKPIEEAYFERQIAKANAQYQARLALEKYEKKYGRR